MSNREGQHARRIHKSYNYSFFSGNIKYVTEENEINLKRTVLVTNYEDEVENHNRYRKEWQNSTIC